MSRFVIGERDFELDGRPFQVIAGAIHFFRVHPGQWADRIEKARLMGLNTIETYVAWNVHAPQRGVFDTAGPRDLGRFLDLVHEAGLRAIVRPGPYICAEWDNGGLPGWLFGVEGMRLRSSEPGYLAAVEEYLGQVLPIVAERQIDRGGPVILVQVENEYGAYGADAAYLRRLVEVNRAHGITVPLTSVDQPLGTMLEDGSLPVLHRTASFGSRVPERLARLREVQPTGPLMCGEFWDGWFDHWGEHHHTSGAEEAAAELDALLAAGASVNIYMFHGGTDFGFTNGANHKGIYKSHVTSYDYDAPLDERGAPTAKFAAFKAVIAKHAAVPEEDPAPAPLAPAPVLPIAAAAPLAAVRDRLGTWVPTGSLATMDEIGRYRGFCVYRAPLGGRGGLLAVGGIRDRAIVSVDGTTVGVLERDRHDRVLAIPAGAALELLVEDRGRVNYGTRLGERKGLIGPVTVDGRELDGWSLLPLDLDELHGDVLDGADEPSGPLVGPVLALAHLDVSEPEDHFLDTAALGKGVVWVNGFHLGRYWSRGPQETLSVPAGVLRAGRNEVLLLELTGLANPELHFADAPRLGPTEE